jgi:hypothetical protein
MAMIVEQSTVCAVMEFSRDRFVSDVLKGPKLEIFGFRVFSQIRPVGVEDLGTRQKNSKF